MAKTHAFGKALCELRGAQGYASAYAFFKKSGAARGLGMTFANYLSLERGSSVPKGWRLERLLSSLGLVPQSTGGRKLIRAFLTDVLGSPNLLDALGEAPAAE